MSKTYIKPSCKVINIELIGMLAMSGQGTDTNNDYDFGGRGTNERHQGWGTDWDNNWEHTWE